MGKTSIGFVLGLLVVPAIGAAVVLSGHFPFQATDKPPRWERRIAGMALDPAIERKAEGLVSPIGMKLYRAGCAGCHGDVGKPSRWGQHNLYPPAPQLADRGVHDPVAEVFVVVKYGIRYTGMGGWKDQVSEDDMWRVATFLTRVGSLPPAVESAWKGQARVTPGESASGDAR